MLLFRSGAITVVDGRRVLGDFGRRGWSLGMRGSAPFYYVAKERAGALL